MGVDAIYLPQVIDACYPCGAANNFYHLNPQKGSKKDFDTMIAAYAQQDIAVVMRICIDCTSIECGLFKDDENRRECYPIADAPNHWKDEQGNSLWHSYNQEYYLSHRGQGFPLLDWNSPYLRSKMGKVIRHWMEQGVKGFVFAGIDRCMYDLQGSLCFQELDSENLKVVRFLKDVVSEKSDCCSIGELTDAEESKFTTYSQKSFDMLLRGLPNSFEEISSLENVLNLAQGGSLCYLQDSESCQLNFRFCLLSYLIFGTSNLLLQDSVSPNDLQGYQQDNFLMLLLNYKKKAVLGVEKITQEKYFCGFLLKCVDVAYVLGINFGEQEYLWQSISADKVELMDFKVSILNGGVARGDKVGVLPQHLVLAKLEW